MTLTVAGSSWSPKLMVGGPPRILQALLRNLLRTDVCARASSHFLHSVLFLKPVSIRRISISSPSQLITVTWMILSLNFICFSAETSKRLTNLLVYTMHHTYIYIYTYTYTYVMLSYIYIYTCCPSEEKMCFSLPIFGGRVWWPFDAMRSNMFYLHPLGAKICPWSQ